MGAELTLLSHAHRHTHTHPCTLIHFVTRCSLFHQLFRCVGRNLMLCLFGPVGGSPASSDNSPPPAPPPSVQPWEWWQTGRRAVWGLKVTHSQCVGVCWQLSLVSLAPPPNWYANWHATSKCSCRRLCQYPIWTWTNVCAFLRDSGLALVFITSMAKVGIVTPLFLRGLNLGDPLSLHLPIGGEVKGEGSMEKTLLLVPDHLE